MDKKISQLDSLQVLYKETKIFLLYNLTPQKNEHSFSKKLYSTY